jgi:hypothetical protein
VGSPSDVKHLISTALSGGVVWFDDGWGQYGDDTCMLEFSVGDENPVICVSVQARGLGSEATLLKVAQANNWHLLDDALQEVQPEIQQ